MRRMTSMVTESDGGLQMVLIRYAEAAERLCVSDPTARRLGAAGHLQQVRVSPGAVRVTLDSVERWLAEHTETRAAA
jgi:excisionase family DNA binding protein